MTDVLGIRKEVRDVATMDAVSRPAGTAAAVLVAVIVALLELTAGSASAQFLQRGLTYGDGLTFIVRVPLINGVRGIFVVRLPEEEPVQTFDLERLPDQANSVFLNVKDDGSFGSVTLPKGGQYAIEGAVTLQLGDGTRVAIDGVYASIVSERKDQEPAVMGFRGIEELFRFTGEQALLVEANRIFESDKRLSQMIKPYAVNGSDLTVNGRRVTGQTIGVALDYSAKNRCFNEGARYVARGALEKVFAEKDLEKRKELIKTAVDTAKVPNPLDDAVTVGADDKEIIAYAYSEGGFRVIRNLPTIAGEPPLCSVAPLTLQ